MSVPFRLNHSIVPATLVVLVTFLYWIANSDSGWTYDYTFRIAEALLQGRLGIPFSPSPALNELIPLDGSYYSAFPLGSVLTMVPVAALKMVGILRDFPGTVIAALVAGLCTWLFWLLSGRYHASLPRRTVLTLFPLLGTWMWANLAFAGAWHISLGLAVAGQVGALYLLLVKRNPFWAGACFALAFGNRTEIILLAPLFLLLIHRSAQDRQVLVREAISFLMVPVALGLATLGYNFARFGSPFDFGYARIPGVLEEPWYAHGIFSIHAIPLNFREMLLAPWKMIATFPYFVPSGFGGSILISSPYLLYLLRCGSRDRVLKYLAWSVVAVLTFVLWLHGNPGGWQFSYRYAIELLPWVFLILQENSPHKVGRIEMTLFLASVLINAYGTYVFLRASALIMG